MCHIFPIPCKISKLLFNQIFLFTACGEEIMLEADEEIVITSPGFPQYYPNYFECVWTVKAPKGRHIGVGFEYFSLENGADFLEIGDGTTVGDGTVDKLTGNKVR